MLPGKPTTAPPLPRNQLDRRSAGQRWTTEALFDGANVVVIEHAGQDYVLRITRKGRLLLNKREGV